MESIILGFGSLWIGRVIKRESDIRREREMAQANADRYLNESVYICMYIRSS